jgi:hypothetical protein
VKERGFGAVEGRGGFRRSGARGRGGEELSLSLPLARAASVQTLDRAKQKASTQPFQHHSYTSEPFPWPDRAQQHPDLATEKGRERAEEAAAADAPRSQLFFFFFLIGSPKNGTMSGSGSGSGHRGDHHVASINNNERDAAESNRQGGGAAPTIAPSSAARPTNTKTSKARAFFGGKKVVPAAAAAVQVAPAPAGPLPMPPPPPRRPRRPPLPAAARTDAPLAARAALVVTPVGELRAAGGGDRNSTTTITVSWTVTAVQLRDAARMAALRAGQQQQHQQCRAGAAGTATMISDEEGGPSFSAEPKAAFAVASPAFAAVGAAATTTALPRWRLLLRVRAGGRRADVALLLVNGDGGGGRGEGVFAATTLPPASSSSSSSNFTFGSLVGCSAHVEAAVVVAGTPTTTTTPTTPSRGSLQRAFFAGANAEAGTGARVRLPEAWAIAPLVVGLGVEQEDDEDDNNDNADQSTGPPPRVVVVTASLSQVDRVSLAPGPSDADHAAALAEGQEQHAATPLPPPPNSCFHGVPLPSAVRSRLERAVSNATVVSRKPLMLVAEDVIDAETCSLLCGAAVAAGPMVRSRVASGGETPSRTSRSYFFQKREALRTLAVQVDREILAFARACAARVGRAGGGLLSRTEQLQVICYGRDDFYRAHYDHRVGITLTRNATVLVYLCDTPAGGATWFPNAERVEETEGGGGGVRVYPRRGRALIFWSTHASGEQDDRSLHSAEEVLEGQKWLASRWLNS